MFRLNIYTPPERVDREKHIIYGVSLIQAGVEALGHKMQTDETTIHQVAQLGQARAKGLKSRFTHPGLSSDGMGKFLGRLHNHRVASGKAVADLHLSELAAKSPDGDLRDYTESLAEDEPDMFGMSIVFAGKKVWILPSGEELDAGKHPRPDNATTKLPLVRVEELKAADLVDEPAANRDGLFSAAFGNTTSLIAEQAFTSIDYYTQLHNLKPDDLPALLDAYYAHNFEAIPPDIQQYIDLMLAQTNYQPSNIYSFIHRYVLARQVRPFVISSHPQPKEVTHMEPENTVEETAVAEKQAPAPQTNGEALAQKGIFDGFYPGWLDRMQTATIAAMLNNSGLPRATLNRLKRGKYTTPEELSEAIVEAREELAALAEDETIDLPRRPITDQDMLTAGDRAQDMVNWFFGVEGAPTPAYNYRKFDQLYVALSGDIDFTGVFRSEYVEFAGASPVTLPNMAVDAMQKVVRAQFSRLRYYRWYELVATVEPNDGTLHDPKWIIYGGTGDLPIVPDGDAYTEGEIDDSKETDAFEKRGRYVGITRKMIKNSDIARIRAIPVALATDAVRTRSAKIAAIFTAQSGTGPNLADGNPLFHASRNNIAATALGTDTTAWEAASEECFGHTEVGSGKPIATFAKYNLVPKDLYFQALKNFGYGDGNPTTYNPFAVKDRSPEDPRPVVLTVPDWSDATNWAYLADPMIWPVILMTYSQNPGGRSHPEPEIFTVTSETAGLMFTNDSMPVKVRDEFAAGVNGGAGIGKRNVP